MSDTHVVIGVESQLDGRQTTFAEQGSVANLTEGQKVSQDRASLASGQHSLETSSSNSSSSAPLGDMAGAKAGQHYQPKKDILTRIECITDSQMKVSCDR